MDYRILGPLEVDVDGVPVGLVGGRQRALLALLLVNANRAMRSEELVEELWDGSPPPSAAKILQNYVSQLRRMLGDGRLLTRGHGYELRVEPGELDVDRVEELLEAGRRAMAADEPDVAAATFRSALALWRGSPLVDVAGERFAHADVERLEELRLAALAERVEADLVLGKHAELIGELEALTARHPFQERLYAQRMLALYRSGRQAEALEAYRVIRHSLVGQLGIEPGQRLQMLERAILTHDPQLELRRAPARHGAGGDGQARTRRRALAAAIAAVAVLGAVSVGTLFDRSRADGVTVDPAYSIAVIDPRSNSVTDRVTVGLGPSAIATGAGSVWVLNQGDPTVSKIDPTTRRVTRTIPLPGTSNQVVTPTAMAFGHGAVWVADGNAATVTRINPLGGTDLPVRIHARFENDVLHVATGAGAVWVVSLRRSTVYRLDPVTKRTTARARIPAVPGEVVAGKAAVWVVSVRPASAVGELATSGALTRLDPVSLRILSHTPLPFPPSGLAVGFDAVWVTLGSQNTVLRIDPGTGAVDRTIAVGDAPADIAVSGDSVWVVNAKSLTLSRIDPVTNTVVATVPVAGTPGAIAAGFGGIWVTGV